MYTYYQEFRVVHSKIIFNPLHDGCRKIEMLLIDLSRLCHDCLEGQGT